ncbi:hypothetical protein EJB05_17358, partial [Eragrostis curvula]
MAHLPRFPVIVVVVFLLVAHVPARHGNPLPSTYDGSICSESFGCGGVEVRYPFYIANATRAAPAYGSYSCGYTDLKIFCQDVGKTATPLIQLGQYNYTVKGINYNSSTLVVADADAFPGGNGGCPNVRHNVSLLGSDRLSYTGYNDDLTFFLGCYQRDAAAMPPELNAYKILDCPGLGNPLGGGASFVFSPDEHGASGEYDLANQCSEIVVMPVLSDSLAGLSNRSTLPREYGGVLRDGFELAWNETTDCYRCERSGGRCAYTQNKLFMGCLCSDKTVRMPDCSSSDASSTTRSPRSKSLSN